MERRRFVVVGLGGFGSHVARYLYEMGHDVLALDHHRAAVEEIQPFCSRAALADAANRDDLEAAGVQGADVGIVGLGTRMDSSILATLFLKELGVKEILVKAISHDHGRILARIGATEVIHPERDVAHRLAENLAEPDLLERLPFLEGYALVEIRAPRAFWNGTLAKTGLRQQHRLSVVLVKRGGGVEEETLLATGELELRQGDRLVVLARGEDVDRFRKEHPE